MIGSSVQTRFGRRLTLLFVASALVPLIVIAVIGYFQVRRQLLTQGAAQLEGGAKNAGMGLLGDLIQAGQPDSIGLRLELQGSNPARILLVHPDGRREEIDRARLFAGATNRATIGNEPVALCVRESGTGIVIQCDEEADDEDMVRGSWDLFLQRIFDAQAWSITVAQSRASILAPIRSFRRTFLLSIVFVLGLVLLLSSLQVRRNVRPLVALREGTERLARGEFDTPVTVSSNDELEDLARSFNGMAGQLKDTISRLDALSYGALAALARTIDASSAWTAGHSSRVTSLSIRMGQRAGLSKDELGTLRRGGLLHDIGKIGVGPRIIDKEGPLTEDELRQIREHPALGARILRPIAAFKDAIPVVLHHHERFDGAGYPHGLSGLAIPKLARLLAVADVYDALVSARPYREGWAQDAAIDAIRSSSGSHLDPEYVEIFLGVIAEEGDVARFSMKDDMPDD